MFFTREDILKIQQALLQLGVKDSELPSAKPVTYDDTLSIVQDGKNKQIGVKDFCNQISLWKREDFINITDKYDKHYISLIKAINLVPILQRKDGLVITFQDVEGNWEIYQFRGNITEFFEENKWFNLYDYRNNIIQSIVPDEEDLTASIPDEKGNSLVSLKDRVYDPTSFSGKGHKILRKNIQSVNIAVTKIKVEFSPSSDGTLSFSINDKETQVPVSVSVDNTTTLVADKIATKLTETMTEYEVSKDASTITLTRKFGGVISTPSSFSAGNTGVSCSITDSTKKELRNILTPIMINQPNTIYEIRYDFDLNGATTEIHEGCTLNFNGGSLKNGTILFNETLLNGNINITSTVNLKGKCRNSFYNAKDFGCKADGTTDDAPAIRGIINIINNRGGGTLYLPKGIYYIGSQIEFIKGNPYSWSAFQLLGSIEVCGDGDSSKLLFEMNLHPEVYSKTKAVMSGEIFSNITKSGHTPIAGDVKFHDFCIEYTSPTVDAMYAMGEAISINRGRENYWMEPMNCNVYVYNMSFVKAYGGITVKATGVHTFYAENNRHIKSGCDIDKHVFDYNSYFITARNCVITKCYFDVTLTAIETHDENDNIFGNTFERCSVAYIMCGTMTNPTTGEIKKSYHKFHDNIVIAANRCICPYYYSNSQVYKLEIYNNDVTLQNGVGRPVARDSIYLFPSTDSAQGDTNWLPIKNIHIHDEKIRQDDETVDSQSLYSRILRNTAVENLIVERCTFENLALMPILVRDNHKVNHMKSVKFNDNVLVNCGRLVDYTSNISYGYRSIVFLGIDSIYDGRELTVEVIGNKIRNANEASVLFQRANSSSVKCNTKIYIKDNDISVKEPIYIPSVSEDTDTNESFHIQAKFYDNTTEVVNYLNKHVLGTFLGAIADDSCFSVYYNNSIHYDIKVFKNLYGAYMYKMEGYDTSPERELGHIPLGTVIHDLTRPGYDYVAINSGINSKRIRKFGTNVYDATDIISSELKGLNAYNIQKSLPMWLNSSGKWKEYDGEEVGIKRAGNTNERPTNVRYGFQYYDIDLQESIVWNGNWRDSNGVVVDGINKRRGTTEERESLHLNKEENIGFIFFDTSLKKYVMWDAVWKNLDGTELATPTSNEQGAENPS